MAGQRKSVRINLTPEQRDQVHRVTGKQADALELTVEELEERIAPVVITNTDTNKAIIQNMR